MIETNNSVPAVRVMHRSHVLAASQAHAQSRLQVIAVERENGLEIWLANLTNSEIICDLDNDIRDVAILDEGSFVVAAGDPNAITEFTRSHSGKRIAFAGYAVARIRI